MASPTAPFAVPTTANAISIAATTVGCPLERRHHPRGEVQPPHPLLPARSASSRLTRLPECGGGVPQPTSDRARDQDCTESAKTVCVDDHCHPEEGAHPPPSATRGSRCADRRIFIGNGRGSHAKTSRIRRDGAPGVEILRSAPSFPADGELARRLPQNDTVCRIRITTLFADSVLFISFLHRFTSRRWYPPGSARCRGRGGRRCS
jgi:hypothetical protein